MRILFYGINYFPELTGIGKYTGEMAEWLVSQGHAVDVITALPYYPEWKIKEEYSSKSWMTEISNGVRIMRCPLYVPKNVTSIKRIVHELSFVISSLRFWSRVFVSKPYDIVICFSPPFHLGLLPVLYTQLRGVPLWCHIQDLQIDMAKDLGMINNKLFLNLMFFVERIILKHSSVVSTISKGMIRKILAKKVLNQECLFFPNWVDDKHISVLPKEASLKREFGIPMEHKIILYSGSLGEKQGLEIILEVAEAYRTQSDVHFLIVGAGGGRERLEELARQKKLGNVRFFPLQPYDKLGELLASADVHLVLQKKSASDLVLPSKLTSILSAGGCSIVSALPGTTLYDIIDEFKMGILVEPESVIALKEGIDKALSTDLNCYRENARRYAEQFLSKETILRRFEMDLLLPFSKKSVVA
ncbi:glycosyl transferase [Arsenicibacter rosenii]|uniref:Glycosyl transferase n=2 Tax=Arsenicibacter rosenii TaxID=1750698 RepID=A0A1S2VMT9_9BACT|nr:glycosyl transferase [Arsenicibacter rosenii]